MLGYFCPWLLYPRMMTTDYSNIQQLTGRDFAASGSQLKPTSSSRHESTDRHGCRSKFYLQWSYPRAAYMTNTPTLSLLKSRSAFMIHGAGKASALASISSQNLMVDLFNSGWHQKISRILSRFQLPVVMIQWQADTFLKCTCRGSAVNPKAQFLSKGTGPNPSDPLPALSADSEVQAHARAWMISDDERRHERYKWRA